jgi:polyferredoxin
MTMPSVRQSTQAGFLALTIAGVFIVGGNAERWCPFGGVEAIYTYATEGNLVCSLGVSNFYILGALLLSVLLLRRAFCGYACPLGTLSDWLHRAGRRLRLPQIRVPRRADAVLSCLKYAILIVILLFTWRTSELVFRGYDPCYALLSRHGEDITFWAYVISGALVIASLLMSLPLCRWLCPLAPVMNPFSRFGLSRIQRDPHECTECGVCSESCPMGIPVDAVRQVRHARCISCQECVEVCPQPGVLRWTAGGKKRAWSPAVVASGLIAVLGLGVAASYAFPLPSFVRVWESPPAQTATLNLKLTELTCRGRASLLVFFLERDDEFMLPGYRRLEAWPGPGEATVRIMYDPQATDAATIRSAITEPYFNLADGLWYTPPFRIVDAEADGTVARAP